MAGLTTAYANAVLDALFGSAALAIPATWHLALFTVAPTDAGGGTEVTGGSYARVGVTNNLTNFPAAVNGAKSNGVAITWPAATADWGEVVALGLFDAATVGNLRAWCRLQEARTVLSGDVFELNIGDLDISAD